MNVSTEDTRLLEALRKQHGVSSDRVVIGEVVRHQ